MEQKPFEKLSKKAKRVAIAQDVLKQLRRRGITAQKGVYAQFKGDCTVGEYGVGGKVESCQVCALGAAFVSAACLGKGQSLQELYNLAGYGFRRSTPLPTIRETVERYFDIAQLDLIEASFEMDEGFLNQNEPTRKPSPKGLRAVDFGKRYRGPRKRLVAIMKNVIDNDGEFLP